MSKSPDRILIVEDDLEDLDLIKEYIGRVRQFPTTLETVSTISEGLQRLMQNDFDVVLLDLSLPDGQGLDAIVDCFNRLSHVMGIQTIAEFVDNQATLEKLQHIGVD